MCVCVCVGVRMRLADLDNRTLATGSADMTARLWDTITLRCLRVVRKHDAGITAVAIWRDMFVTGSADCSVGVWDLRAEPLRQEASEELDLLQAAAADDEAKWTTQERELRLLEEKLERKLDNDEPSDAEERADAEAAGLGAADGDDNASIKTEDLFKSSSSETDSSEFDGDGLGGEDESSGDVSTTDSDDPKRERRITVREKEEKLVRRLIGSRVPARPEELRLRMNRKGHLAGAGYATFTRGEAYNARQERLAREDPGMIRRAREAAIKRGEARVQRARAEGEEDVVDEEDEASLLTMVANLRSNWRARRNALKDFAKMRKVEKRKRRTQRRRLRRLAAIRKQRRELQRMIAHSRRRTEQRVLSLQRQMTAQKGPGAYSEGQGVVRITAESLGFDNIDMETDARHVIAAMPRHNLLLSVHTATVTSIGLATPQLVSGDAIGVIIVWDIVRAVPLRVVDTQPGVPLPRGMSIPDPAVLRSTVASVAGIVGVARRRFKLPDGRVVTRTVGLDDAPVRGGADGMGTVISEVVDDITSSASSVLRSLGAEGLSETRAEDLAADAVSSDSEDEAAALDATRRRIAGMSTRERVIAQAKEREAVEARRVFLETVTGLPSRYQGEDRAMQALAFHSVGALGDVDEHSGHLTVTVRRSRYQHPHAHPSNRLAPLGSTPKDAAIAAAAAAAGGSSMSGGVSGMRAEDLIDRIRRATETASQRAALVGYRRFPVTSIALDTRRIVAGVTSGALFVFDMASLERVGMIHPIPPRRGELSYGGTAGDKMRLLPGGITFDSRTILAAYNDGRVRRWNLYTGDGDDEDDADAGAAPAGR